MRTPSVAGKRRDLLPMMYMPLRARDSDTMMRFWARK